MLKNYKIHMLYLIHAKNKLRCYIERTKRFLVVTLWNWITDHCFYASKVFAASWRKQISAMMYRYRKSCVQAESSTAESNRLLESKVLVYLSVSWSEELNAQYRPALKQGTELGTRQWERRTVETLNTQSVGSQQSQWDKHKSTRIRRSVIVY